MDNLFYRMVRQHTPEFNPLIVEGLATHYMKEAETYLHTAFMANNDSLIPGLEYVGYRVCTEAEEYYEATKLRNNKRTYDIARSDMHMIMIEMKYKGKPLPPRPIYLPFVGEAGTMYINGVLYHLPPVLTDNVISPDDNSVFIRILKGRMTLPREYHNVSVNGKIVTANVIGAPIHHQNKAQTQRAPQTTKANKCVLHYLLGKYGFTKTFEKYLGYVPMVEDETYDRAKYENDNWVICTSSYYGTSDSPKTYMSGYYKPTNIHIMFEKDKWNALARSFVTELFYILDNFPEMFRPVVDELNEVSQWRLTIGHIIESGDLGAGHLLKKVAEHYKSLDHYLDYMHIQKLRNSGYFVEDFYDLLALVMKNFREFRNGKVNSRMSMYGKSLEVLYFALYNITYSYVMTGFRLAKLASKRELTADDIVNLMNKSFRLGSSFGLTSGSIAAETVSYSGDHKFLKITSKTNEQEANPGGRRGSGGRTAVNDSTHLHISHVVGGSVLYLSKSNPSPVAHSNPFLQIDPSTGMILENMALKPILDAAEHELLQISNVND